MEARLENNLIEIQKLEAINKDLESSILYLGLRNLGVKKLKNYQNI